MYVYRNSNTGDFAEMPTRSVRLDHLPNWQLIEATAEAPTPAPAAEGQETVSIPVIPSRATRPLDTDNKAAWVEYAVYRGMTTSDAKALSKATLIQEFGEESTNGED